MGRMGARQPRGKRVDGELVWLDLVRLRRELARRGGLSSDDVGPASASLRSDFCAAAAAAPTRPAILVELLMGWRTLPDSLDTLTTPAPGWMAAEPEAVERSRGEVEARQRARRRMGEATAEELSWLLQEIGELQSAGRLGPALRAANRAVDDFGADPEVLLVRGGLRMRLGAWEAARDDAHRATAMVSDAPRAHLILSESFDLQGRRLEAKAALQRGRHLAPQSHHLRVAEAEMASREGDFERASALWDELLARRPSVRAWIGRSRIRQLGGQLDEALADAEAAIDTAPDDGRAWARRAALHEQIGQTEAASHDWCCAFEADAGRPEAYLERGVVRRAGRPVEALVDALTARTLAAGEPRIRAESQALLRLLRRPCKRAGEEQFAQARQRLWAHLTRLIASMIWGAARDLLAHAAVVDPRLDLRVGMATLLLSSPHSTPAPRPRPRF